MQALELDLDVYQGPFDLLFTLILKEEVDIREIQILEIILAYLEQMVRRGDVDWEGLTEFLVLISSLLEIKSRALLPGFAASGDEEEPEDALALLYQRLVEYHKFKNAASALRGRADAQRGRLVREPAARPRPRLAALEDVAGSEDPRLLRDCMRRVLQSRAAPGTAHLPATPVDLEVRLDLVRSKLAEVKRFSFNEVFGRDSKLVQGVTLFAVLELLTGGRARAYQRKPFGDITVSAVKGSG